MHRRSRLAALGSTVALLMVGADPARAQNSEVVTLLQDLVRVNTSNPPGNEALIAISALKTLKRHKCRAPMRKGRIG